jgi:hypothetical protein
MFALPASHRRAPNAARRLPDRIAYRLSFIVVFMFCAFDGPPKIVRLHGTGWVCQPGSPDFASLASLFPDFTGRRAIVRARLSRVSDSCGFGVPRYQFADDRDQLVRWSESKGEERLTEYRQTKNARSLDGLPGIAADD